MDYNVIELYNLMIIYLGYARGTLNDNDNLNLDVISNVMIQINDSGQLVVKDSKINNITYEFIKNNIVNVIYKIIKLNDERKSNLFKCNIKRIEKCIGYDILGEESIHIQLFKIHVSLITDKRELFYQSEMVKCIISYAIDKSICHLDNLFIFAIKCKQYGIIDKLKRHIEIDRFIDKTKTKTKTPNDILKMKGHKLINLLKTD